MMSLLIWLSSRLIINSWRADCNSHEINAEVIDLHSSRWSFVGVGFHSTSVLQYESDRFEYCMIIIAFNYTITEPSMSSKLYFLTLFTWVPINMWIYFSHHTTVTYFSLDNGLESVESAILKYVEKTVPSSYLISASAHVSWPGYILLYLIADMNF